MYDFLVFFVKSERRRRWLLLRYTAYTARLKRFNQNTFYIATVITLNIAFEVLSP